MRDSLVREVRSEVSMAEWDRRCEAAYEREMSMMLSVAVWSLRSQGLILGLVIGVLIGVWI